MNRRFFLVLFTAGCFTVIAGAASKRDALHKIDATRKGEKPSLAFVTYIGAPYQEYAAAMLVDSIRTWGGEYRDCPIYVVVTDPGVSGDRLKDMKVNLVPLKLDESIRNYPFAEKAYAAARVEELVSGRVRSLAWFDPQTLLFRPPLEMDLDDGVSAAVAPVQSINTGQAEDEPVNAYCGAIYKRCGLDLRKLFLVETKVDCRTIRAWLNFVPPADEPLKKWLIEAYKKHIPYLKSAHLD